MILVGRRIAGARATARDGSPRGRLRHALLLAAASCALISHARPPAQNGSGDRRAIEWVASEAERALARTDVADADLAGVALAIRALAGRLELDPDRRDRMLAALIARQRDDGSFGAPPGSKPLTWMVVGALPPSSRDDAGGAARRAVAWLASQSGPTAPVGGSRGEREPTARALEFLRRSRATAAAEYDEATLGLFSLAGGVFDVRAAYADALASDADARGRADPLPGSALVSDPLHALAVTVAVLDHYRSSKEAALLAETARPAAGILRDVATRRDDASGAWRPEEGAAPSLASSASALTILGTLEGWDAARLVASPDELRANRAQYATDMGSCEGCHDALQPAQVAQWRGSAHARQNVGCADCHGQNHSKIFRESGRVSPATCATCHAEAVAQFEGSKHARAEETLLASALFEATPPAARAACLSCHQIGARQLDGTSGSCNHCHLGHAFEARAAREPGACTVCHTGADYPQDLAYRLSKHGALYESVRDPVHAPTCTTCHNPGGRHDDSFGITIGGSGVGAALEGSSTAFDAHRISPAEFARRRAEMVAVCARCHSSRLAEASLRQADELKREGERHLIEALELLRRLDAQGCFGASGSLAVGPDHARPDPGAPGARILERFYEMWRFEHTSAWKGAYHQSPSVSNHGSGTGTREALAEIRAEAERWLSQGGDR